MTITACLFEAFLKCPTKCWLRATNEQPSGNAYAEWKETQNESYRVAESERLRAQAPPDDSALSPPVENLKTAKWRLAVDVVAQANLPPPSGGASYASPTNPSNSGPPETRPSDVFVLDAHLYAVERVPSEGRGKAAQFIPIRFL